MPNAPDILLPTFVHHGASALASLEVDCYGAELREGDGFVGDRASKRAFHSILDRWRERLRQVGDDPLGEKPSEEIGKKRLDKLLTEGTVETAGLILSAVEEFAQELATVIGRFLELRGWEGTQRLAIGGGLRASRIGELAIGRAGVLLKANGTDLELRPIHHHPDEAGLVGSVHLTPAWVLSGHGGMLAVDIGGTNIRAGVVELNRKKAEDFSAARVAGLELWRHADDAPGRDQAVERLAEMLRSLARRATKDDLQLAPIIGIGCPGLIRDDGSITKGGHNLPGGDWEAGHFNLPERLRQLLPDINGAPTVVLVHNDAVVQGLSETPCMRDVERWGILTIGTGLGNARFTNRFSACSSVERLRS